MGRESKGQKSTQMSGEEIQREGQKRLPVLSLPALQTGVGSGLRFSFLMAAFPTCALGNWPCLHGIFSTSQLPAGPWPPSPGPTTRNENIALEPRQRESWVERKKAGV